MYEIDVIIPAHNEEGNIYDLGERLVQVFSKSGLSAHIIFVDDHSTDNTASEAGRLINALKNGTLSYFSEDKAIEISLIKKEGPQGKATSVLQGIRYGNSEFVAMIDADLQYPPEAIPEMFELAKDKGICVANRISHKTGFVRSTGSKINQLVFEKWLLGLNCDSQSGLKVFRKDIITYLDTSLVSSWTLDMPLLLTAKELGYEIAEFDIEFSERKSGRSKVNLIKTSWEIATNSLKLRFRKRNIIEIKPEIESTVGSGVIFKGKKYITHSRLPAEFTAINTFWPWQEFAAALLFSLLLFGVIFNAKLTAIIFIALLSSAYFSDLIFSAFLVWRTLKKTPEIKVSQDELDALKDEDLPVYTILCPLYKEARVLTQFTENIAKIDWPKEKLDVILLLEEDDRETIEAAQKLNLPHYFRTLVVPDSFPKTKPKACNYGLAHAKGEYLVIYDAEDRPDPKQLKKVFITFSNTDSKVVCLQCKLNYYNSGQNMLTRLFTAEYSLWFELILPGLQSLSTTIPLGGTSNHFRTSALKYLDGWDPFNVTEDCDLGARLFKKNFLTEVVDSTTYEEANSKVRNWVRQRSRWIKGYLQTYLVHMRHPMTFYKNYGWHALLFQVITGLRMTFTLINPILWIMTISYFMFRAKLGPAIEQLYPGAVFYLSTFALVAGNFFYMYVYMIALAKRNQWHLIKYVFFMPLYWLLGSWAAVVAFYQLIRKPFYWEKTTHGLHLPEEIKAPAETQLPVAASTEGGFISAVRRLPSVVLNIRLTVPLKFKGSLFTPTVINGSMLVFLTLFSNGLNFIYSAYLSRRLVVEDFGMVYLNGSLLAVMGILTAGFSSSVTFRGGHLTGIFGTPVKVFWKRVFGFLRPFSLALTLVWLLNMPFLASTFKTTDILPFLLFAPIITFGFLAAINNGFLYGSLKFRTVGIFIMLENLSKLVITIALVEAGLEKFVYLGLSASIAVSFLLGYIYIKRLKTPEETETKANDLNLKFPYKFFTTSIVISLSTAIFLNADVILSKHFLNPMEAGNYALLSLSGKMVFLLGSLFTQFINPVISKYEGAHKSTRLVFYKLLSICILASLGGYLLLGILGYITVPLFFGPKVQPIIPYLPIYTLGIASFVVGFSIIVYHQTKQQYLPAVVGFLVSIAQIIYILLYHDSIYTISYIVGITGVIYLAGIFLIHVFYYSLEFVYRALKDFAGIFSGNTPQIKVPEGKLRILIFNWRDTKHIWAGGAEIYIQEIAKRWVAQDNAVTIFSGNDGKSARNEVIDGVNIVRRGGFYLVYLWAFLYYIFRFRGKFDVIVDCENGLPFFTPFYSTLPKVLLIHHIHQSVFRENLMFPFSLLAELLESKLMRLAYRNVKMVTVSESSRADMERIGLSQNQPIDIVHPGIDTAIFKPGNKSGYPNILYLGRLKAYKSLETVIKAMPKVLNEHPEAVLRIAGFGEARKYLEKLSRGLGLDGHVKFLGRVSDEARIKLMQKAWVFVHPSTMEGWGISVIEANACATPVVASDVPGLRDSVKNPVSGFLVKPKNVDEFAEKINLILSDDQLRNSLSYESVKWANEFTWDKSAEEFMDVIVRTLTPSGSLVFAPQAGLAKTEE